jgi:hypothetical protein
VLAFEPAEPMVASLRAAEPGVAVAAEAAAQTEAGRRLDA